MTQLNLALSSIPLQPQYSALAIEQMHSRLSLENDLGTDTNVLLNATLPAFAGMLVESIAKLGTTFTGLMSSNETQDNQELSQGLIRILQDDYLSKEPAYTYTYLSSTVITIPESFTGSMLNYLQFMAKSSSQDEGLYKNTLAMLREYKAFLADFITNKDARAHFTVAEPIYKQASDMHKDYLKEMQSYFPTNNGKSKARLGSIFERMADIKDSFQFLKKLENNYREAPVHDIKVEADRCAELLNIISSDGGSVDPAEVSKPVAKKLAQGAFTLAKLLEYMSVHRFHHKVVMTSCVSMHRDITKAMK